jgi:hypothetical protein
VTSRAADPYRDLDVIDSRGPRTNQAVIGLGAVLALATGWWWLLGLLALQLAIGLTFGRRYCLPCLLWFEVLQPRLGEGTLEDSRPPRFANLVGLVVLGSATLAFAAGLESLGIALGALVAVLALVAAVTGFCTGCEAYKLGCLLRGRPFVSCPLPPQPSRATAGR